MKKLPLIERLRKLIKRCWDPLPYGLLPDTAIATLCEPNNGRNPMITPFFKESVKRIETPNGSLPVISYGVSSYGYDFRIKRTLEMFMPGAHVVDPKDPSTSRTVPVDLEIDPNGAAYFLLPPNSYFLAVTAEKFDIPTDVMGICAGKSTYARIGVFINLTPLEPGWRGELVVEIFNPQPVPVKLYPDEGVGQIFFFRGEDTPNKTYSARSAKYQDQVGIVKARVE